MKEKWNKLKELEEISRKKMEDDEEEYKLYKDENEEE
jgi:hypothetical protein